MHRKSRLLFHSFGCGLVSVALIVCIITSPLCAAHCVGNFCTPGAGAREGAENACHSGASDHSSVLKFAAVPARNSCSNGELVFTALRVENFSVSLASWNLAGATQHSNGSSLATGNTGELPSWSPPLGIFDLSASVPLRI